MAQAEEHGSHQNPHESPVWMYSLNIVSSPRAVTVNNMVMVIASSLGRSSCPGERIGSLINSLIM